MIQLIKILPLSLLIVSTHVFGQDLSTRFDELSIYRKIKLTVETEILSSTINTVASSTSESASLSSTISYVGPKAEYVFDDNLSVAASAGSIIYTSINLQGNKIELDLLYYFMDKPSIEVVKTNTSLIELSSKFTPYVTGGYNTTNLYLNNSNLNFTGISLGAGANYYYLKNIPINLELGYKYLLNNSVRSLTGVSLSVGFGILY